MQNRLERVYRVNRQALFALALSITGARDLAEDAVHDAFVRLCTRTIEDVQDLVPYVFAAVRNSAIDISRRQKRSAESVSLFEIGDAANSSSRDGEVAALRTEEDRILREAVETLEPALQEVVIMRVFAELRMSDIAAITNTPVKTVETRYRRALQTLEERLRGKM